MDNQKKILDYIIKPLYIGLYVGTFLCLMGVIFVFLNISGSITWTVETIGIVSKIINASPGIVCIICGAILIIVFRIKIKILKNGKEIILYRYNDSDIIKKQNVTK